MTPIILPPAVSAGASVEDARRSSMRNGVFIRETFELIDTFSEGQLPASPARIQYMPVMLMAGDVVTNIVTTSTWNALVVGSNADGHWWFAIHGPTGLKIDQTADQGNTAWPQYTKKALPLLGGPYIAAVSGAHFLSVMVHPGTGGAPACPSLPTKDIGDPQINTRALGLVIPSSKPYIRLTTIGAGTGVAPADASAVIFNTGTAYAGPYMYWMAVT